MAEVDAPVQRWPYTEPHVQYTRYGVRMAGGVLLKGLSREDIEDMWDTDPAVVRMFQIVTYVTGGPFVGHEVLGPWKELK